MGLGMAFLEEEFCRDERKLRRPSPGHAEPKGSIMMARRSKGKEAEHRDVLLAHVLGPACCSLSI